MSSQSQVVQQQVPMSKLLEQIGRLQMQLVLAEENAAQVVRNSDALAKRLQETLTENADLKAQLSGRGTSAPAAEPEETVSKSNYAS